MTWQHTPGTDEIRDADGVIVAQTFGPTAAETALCIVEMAARMAQLEARRSEMRVLLHRMLTYVREDRAATPGTTRLARLTEQVADYLKRTHDPADILRAGEKS